MLFTERPANLGLWRDIKIPLIQHELGDLCFAEETRHIPFSIARFYFIFNIPSHASRGHHAHRSISQVIFAATGAFNVNVEYATEKASIRLERPEQGLLIGPMVWKGIDAYDPGSTCLVVASGIYDENEYLRSRSDWISAMHEIGSYEA